MKTFDRPRARMFWGFAGSALAILTGCRDLEFDGGRTLLDDHVLAGRPAAEGGATLTPAERAQRFFVSNDTALARLEADLRAHLDLRYSLRGEAHAFADGRVTLRDPRALSPVFTTGPTTLATSLVAPLFLQAVLRQSDTAPGELQALCAHPLLSSLGAGCALEGLDQLDSITFDDLHVDLDAAAITVGWEEPDPTLDGPIDAPILRITVPFTMDLDPNDGFGALIDVNLQRFAIELRFHPEVCTRSDCASFGREIFHGYTDPLRDAEMSLAGVEVRVVSRLAPGSLHYEIFPTPLCFLGVWEGVSCAILAAEVIPSRLNTAFANIGTSIANVVRPMLSPPAITLPTSSLPSWLTLDAGHIFYMTDPTTLGTTAVPSQLRVLADGSGAWTNGTLDILARGAHFAFVRADLSESPIKTTCDAAPPGSLAEPFCTALCGGASSTCSMDSVKVCFDFHPGTPPCDGGLALDAAEMESLLTLVAAFPGSGFSATAAEIDAMIEQIRAATTPIPPSPNLASALGTAPLVATTLQGVFTGPLEASFGDGATYTDIVSCPATGARPEACPDGVDGPVFLFIVDTDRDGIDDADDACPTDPDTSNVNTDGDAFCDVHDFCPFTPTETNNRRFCSCDHDFDGCNNALEAMPIDSAPPSVPRFCAVGPGGIYDERPARSDEGRDEPDGDGISNDCDPDDDGDGIVDASDNCPDVANPGQEDTNHDGYGDACDALCWGPGAPCPSPEDPGAGAFPFGEIDIDVSAWILPDCLADGPGCWGFLRLACGSFASFGEPCFDDLEIDRLTPDGFVRLTEIPGGARVAMTGPDLNLDGIADLLAVVNVGNLGALRAIDGQTGATLWETASSAAGFGASIAVVGQSIAVGAPDVKVGNVNAPQGKVLFFGFDGTPQALGLVGQSGERLGTMLQVVGSHLYVGAPGSTAQSFGKLYVADLGSMSLKQALDGAALQSAVGRLPIVGLKVQNQPAVIVAGLGAAAGGRLHVIKQAADGKLNGVIAVFNGAPKAELGTSLSAAGDFNGDGKLEIAVGAPGTNNGAGAVFVLTSGGKLEPTQLSSSAGSRFGQRVVRLGDVTADGRSDLAVGLPGRNLAGWSMPGSHAIFGRVPKP